MTEKAGIVKPNSGKVYFKVRNINRNNQEQKYTIIVHFYVLDNIISEYIKKNLSEIKEKQSSLPSE